MVRQGWAPPLRAQEKIPKVQLLAGAPRQKPGPKQAQRPATTHPTRAARRADHDLAKLAQKQYEQLIRQRTQPAQGG